jgi:hypothetical protein
LHTITKNLQITNHGFDIEETPPFDVVGGVPNMCFLVDDK